MGNSLAHLHFLHKQQKKPPELAPAASKKLVLELLAGGTKHLHRLGGSTGLTSRGAGLHGLFLRNKILGHGAKLGSRLSLAAAGAECNGASNGNNESGEFHKRIWLDDSDVYSSKFIKNSQHKFQQPNTF